MSRSTLVGLAAIALACSTLVGCTSDAAPGEPQAAASDGATDEPTEAPASNR